MKWFSLLFVLAGQVFASENDLYTTLKLLSRVYDESPESFYGAKVGVEQGYTSCPLSQASMAFELERELPNEMGYCEYKTETGFIPNMQLLTESLAPISAKIFLSLKDNEQILHITSRRLTFQGEGEDCIKKYIRVGLKNGYFVWLDYL